MVDKIPFFCYIFPAHRPFLHSGFLVRFLTPVLRPASRWVLSGARKHPTWLYEAVAVAFILVIVAGVTTDWTGLTGLSWITAKPVVANWLAVGGVLGSFLQAQVAFRMSEAQLDQASPSVHCHAWSTKYWIVKELTWASVFLLTGAYSALVGNVVFILYPAWRRIHLQTRRSCSR